ncbi:MAG: YIP1 family protein [Acetobacteraceae bacterium]|nr:YIP1 family protein [Acetobacteraceae bacterium]
MDIVARAKGLILQPKEEWYRIAGETADTRSLFTAYAMPMAAIPAAAGFIGWAMIGGMLSMHPGMRHIGIGALLLQSIVTYLLSLVGVWVLGKIIHALAPRFEGNRDEVAAMKLAVYSPTASWLAGIFFILPPLSFLCILGLYSLYIFYRGVPVVAGVPQDRVLGFTVAVILCALVINILVAMLAGCVLWL